MTWDDFLYEMNDIVQDLWQSVSYLMEDAEKIYNCLDADGKEVWERMDNEIKSLDELHSRMLEKTQKMWEANK